MSIYAIGPFKVDAARLTMRREREAIALGPKVVETLLALAEHPDRGLSKQELLDRIWPQGFVQESNLAQNIYVLRKLFRSCGEDEPIETIPGFGYRLWAEVLVHPGGSGSPPFWRRVIGGVAFAAAVVALLVVRPPHFSVSSLSQQALSPRGARLYEVARYYWDLRTREGVLQSLTYFARMVDADPQDARGYAYLAEANAAMGDYCYGTHRPDVYFARAAAYARKALEINPASSDAHAAFGLVALHHSDMVAGIRELQRAVPLDPRNADAHEWLGIALLRIGEHSKATKELRIAASLDPLSVSTIAWLAVAAYLDGRFNEAIAYAQQALELSPKRVDALQVIGEAYEAQGKLSNAIHAFQEYGSVDPYDKPAAAAMIDQAFALGRHTSKVRVEVGRISKQIAPSHPSWAALENADHLGIVLAARFAVR